MSDDLWPNYTRRLKKYYIQPLGITKHALNKNIPFTLTGGVSFVSSTLFCLLKAANLLDDPMKITYDGAQVQLVNHLLSSPNPPRKCHDDNKKASRTTFS